MKELTGRLKVSQKERERVEADKVAIFGEMNEAVTKLEAELRQEKARAVPPPVMTWRACASSRDDVSCVLTCRVR